MSRATEMITTASATRQSARPRRIRMVGALRLLTMGRVGWNGGPKAGPGVPRENPGPSPLGAVVLRAVAVENPGPAPSECDSPAE